MITLENICWEDLKGEIATIAERSGEGRCKLVVIVPSELDESDYPESCMGSTEDKFWDAYRVDEPRLPGTVEYDLEVE